MARELGTLLKISGGGTLDSVWPIEFATRGCVWHGTDAHATNI
jgi:hypothetical protein